MSKQTIAKRERSLERIGSLPSTDRASRLNSSKILASPYWLACILLTAILVIAWNTAVVAQDAEVPLTAEDVQGTLNAIWVLIAAILVIFMNAGFGMLETGFCRQKNAVNILAKNLIVFALATIAFLGDRFFPDVWVRERLLRVRWLVLGK